MDGRDDRLLPAADDRGAGALGKSRRVPDPLHPERDFARHRDAPDRRPRRTPAAHRPDRHAHGAQRRELRRPGGMGLRRGDAASGRGDRARILDAALGRPAGRLVPRRAAVAAPGNRRGQRLRRRVDNPQAGRRGGAARRARRSRLGALLRHLQRDRQGADPHRGHADHRDLDADHAAADRLPRLHMELDRSGLERRAVADRDRVHRPVGALRDGEGLLPRRRDGRHADRFPAPALGGPGRLRGIQGAGQHIHLPRRSADVRGEFPFRLAGTPGEADIEAGSRWDSSRTT